MQSYVRVSLLAFLIASLLAGCVRVEAHPSAASLLRTFTANRTDFDRLLQLFLDDDALGRVADDFTRPSGPDAIVTALPEPRWAEYRALFKQLGLAAGIEGYGDKNLVYFIASAQGLSVSGSVKGYAYTVDAPELIVENLDAYRSPDGRSFTVYQHIDGNWYLYYDYED